MKEKTWLLFLIPLLVAAIFALMNVIGLFQTTENRVYDMLLHLKPPVAEDSSILFLDVDDLAIAKVGVWPWSRDIMADGLILMKEFEVARAVFDIEYVNASPLGINAVVLNQEIPEAFSKEFAEINRNVGELFKALQAGRISLRQAGDFIKDLKGLTESSKDLLLAKIGEIARDNDTYLGQAARFFGSAYMTVNMLPEKDEEENQELKSYVLERIALKNVEKAGGRPEPAADLRPAILPVIRGVKGAGFPNVVVDNDGVRRRIALVREFQGHFFTQLGLTPLLDWLGNPQLVLKPGRIVLKGAVLPGKEARDLVIPLAEDGRMLINWPKKPFMESFHHISYYELVQNQRLEENLLHNLKTMQEAGYLTYHQGQEELLAPYTYAESLKQEILNGGDLAGVKDYREARAYFFQEVGGFLNGEAEKAILGDIDQALAVPGLQEEARKTYLSLKEEVPRVFSASREIHTGLINNRKRLEQNLKGAFCIIGLIGTSTTDIGVNPFEKEYMNVGTHASVVNTILQARFLDDLPWWAAVLIGLAISALATLITRKLAPLSSILVGLGILILFVAGIVTVFLFTGIYLNLMTPALSVFFTFITVSLIKFLRLEKEKSFLRNAFSHYLSTDVINELIADPEKLSLGGQKKYLSAMFTDVRGFSTVSEQLDPTDLVKLLNAYLTEMSNTILSHKGTIDKYEGDAIISFFGAPVSFDDHARRACLSAVRMKKVERMLNEHFLQEKLSPVPLFTRIGINTGDMVVGNMGTLQKMDYTIMGNSVNLASRLEGVNKQYGTWIMISEITFQEGGADFTVRELDRVRVVGIQQPVRLYELIDEKAATEPQVLEALEKFHQGLERFEQKAWKEARKSFESALQILPNDGPSETYLKRCVEYQSKPPPESWDGVFNLTMK